MQLNIKIIKVTFNKKNIAAFCKKKREMGKRNSKINKLFEKL